MWWKGQQPKTGIPGLVFLKNRHTLKHVKYAPHKPSRYSLVKSIFIVPEFWPISGGQRPTDTLSGGLRRLRVRFGWLKLALGRIRVAKAQEEFCGGKRVFFTWSWRVPVSCPILSRGGRYSSRVTCMVCTYINNMWTYLPRCGKWLSNDMQLVRVKK